MTEGILNLYKEVGETPLECIERFRGANPEYRDVKMSYAGRLDPMAEGVLIVLVGEENKNREKYLGLEKNYVVDVLFGVETDSYDVLGLIEKISSETNTSETEVVLHLDSFRGEFEQKFPPYSSKPIEGKPSFVHARQKSYDDITVPSKTVFVRLIELKRMYQLNGEEILRSVIDRVSRVRGDFRQEHILATWKKEMEIYEKELFSVATIEVTCGSGTYMRSIAHELGKKMNGGALAYSIMRTKVSEYDIKNSTR